MQSDVVTFVRHCRECQIHSTKQRKQPAADYKSRQVSRAFEIWSADVFNLSIPSEGYRHILVLQDYLTGFVVLVPIKGESAVEILNAISERIIAYFGPLETLLSDNGSAFISKLAEEIFT